MGLGAVPGPEPESAWVYSDWKCVLYYQEQRTLLYFKRTKFVQSEYTQKYVRENARWGQKWMNVGEASQRTVASEMSEISDKAQLKGYYTANTVVSYKNKKKY